MVKKSNSKTAEFKLVHINIYVNFGNIYLGDFFSDRQSLREPPLWKHIKDQFFKKIIGYLELLDNIAHVVCYTKVLLNFLKTYDMAGTFFMSSK